MEISSKSLRFFRMPKRATQPLLNEKPIEEKVKIVRQSTCDSSVTTAEVLMAAEILCDSQEICDPSLNKAGIKENDPTEVIEKFKTDELLERLEKWEGDNFQETVALLVETWTQLADECRCLHNVVQIFDKLFGRTIQAVLSNKWQALSHAARCCMARVLTRCSQQLGHVVEHAPRLCASLIMSVYDPWGEDGLNDENVERFVTSEPAELVLARVESLWTAKKYDAAMNLCQQYMKLNSNCLDKTQLSYDTQEEEEERRRVLLFFVEWLVRILHRKNLLRDIVTETANCTCHEGVQLIRRIQGGASEESLPLAETLTHLFLVRDLLYPSTYCCTKELMMIWTSLQVVQNRSLKEVCIAAKKLVVLHASTSAHFYLFVDVLWEEFGRRLFPLYLEMYIRGLTADLNHLEVARQERSVAAILEMEAHVAWIYTKLGSLFSPGQEVLARECVLSAFSVEPTPERLQLLHYLTLTISVMKGKIVLPNENEPDLEAQMVLGDILDEVAKQNDCENDNVTVEGMEQDCSRSFQEPEQEECHDVAMDLSENRNRVSKDVESKQILDDGLDEICTEVKMKVEEMVSLAVDYAMRVENDVSEVKKSLHFPVLVGGSGNVVQHKCNCGRLCTTPSDEEVELAKERRPSWSTNYYHPILDNPVDGIFPDLLKDLVIVLESTRHSLLQCCDDWSVMQTPFEEYLEMMAAVRLMLQHTSCYDSADSETDSASDEEFGRNYRENVASPPLAGLLEESEMESTGCRSKSSDRHPKWKMHRHSNDLAKKKRRKKRRRAKKERDRELTVRHVLFDRLDEEKKAPKRRRGRPRKKTKEKYVSEGIDINTADLSAIVNPNARILLSRLEDAARHHDILTRLEEKSTDSLQPIEEIQSHLQSSNLLSGPQEQPPVPMTQTVPSSSKNSALRKNVVKSKLKSKHHRLLKLKKNNKKHRHLKFKKKLKNLVKKNQRKCVNASSQTDDLVSKSFFAPIPHTLLRNCGNASKSLVDEFGKPILTETEIPNVSLPPPPVDQIQNNFAPSICTNTPPMQTKAPSNRLLKKTVPVVQVVMPSFGKAKNKDKSVVYRTNNFSEGMPRSKMSVIAPGKASAPTVVALRVHQDKANKTAVTPDVVTNPDQPAIIIRGTSIGTEQSTIVSAPVNTSPQLITFKTISGAPLQQTFTVANTIQGQPTIQNVPTLSIPISTGIQNTTGKIVAHKLFIPIRKLNNSVELMPLAANNLLTPGNAQAPNVFIVRPQQQIASNVQRDVKPIAAKNQKRFWTSSRDKPPVYEWRKIGPKKSMTQFQRTAAKTPSSSPVVIDALPERTSATPAMQQSAGSSTCVTQVSLPAAKHEPVASLKSIVAQVSIPTGKQQSGVQQNGFAGDIVKRRVSTSDLATLESNDRVMPLRPISEPLDLNGPIEDLTLLKPPLSVQNSDSKDLETLDSSISDAVRFSLMFSDDGIENQVKRKATGLAKVGMSNYNTYQDGYLQSGSYPEPMTERASPVFRSQTPPSFETPPRSSFVSPSSNPDESNAWKAEPSLVQLEAASKKKKKKKKKPTILPAVCKNTKAGVEEIIREIKKKTKAAHESSGKRSTSPKAGPLCHCETCGRGFVSTYNLRRHYKNVHKIEVASPKSAHGGLTSLSLSSPETPFSPLSDTPISPPCNTIEMPNFTPKASANKPTTKKVQLNWHNMPFRGTNYSANQFFEECLDTKPSLQPLVQEQPINLGTRNITVESKNMQSIRPVCFEDATIPQEPATYSVLAAAATIPETGKNVANNASVCNENENPSCFGGRVSVESWDLKMQRNQTNLCALDERSSDVDPFSYATPLARCNSSAVPVTSTSHQMSTDRDVGSSEELANMCNIDVKSKNTVARSDACLQADLEDLDVWNDRLEDIVAGTENNISVSECIGVENYRDGKRPNDLKAGFNASAATECVQNSVCVANFHIPDEIKSCSPLSLCVQNDIGVEICRSCDSVEDVSLPKCIQSDAKIESNDLLHRVTDVPSVMESAQNGALTEGSYFTDQVADSLMENNSLATEIFRKDESIENSQFHNQIGKVFVENTLSNSENLQNISLVQNRSFPNESVVLENNPVVTERVQKGESLAVCSESEAFTCNSAINNGQNDAQPIEHSYSEPPFEQNWTNSRDTLVNSRLEDARNDISLTSGEVSVTNSDQRSENIVQDVLRQNEDCDSDCQVTNIVVKEEKSAIEITLESEDESVRSESDKVREISESPAPKENESIAPLPENNMTRGRTRSREGKKHPKRFCPCCENESPTTKKCRTNSGNSNTSCGKSSKGTQGSKKSIKLNRKVIHTRSSQKPRTRSMNP